ncbi:hypothetical protein QBC47DRAFT_152414 [Echria macrotheca]|uniref:Uncharacterized protein n=1 Tax=Echria macrotheca TaxID=438768 RepID=A0AAJ0B0E3_9PEZI|nr:hypothetical protein QBC47DRAFT_152414 [Echria macrotheca]
MSPALALSHHSRRTTRALCSWLAAGGQPEGKARHISWRERPGFLPSIGGSAHSEARFASTRCFAVRSRFDLSGGKAFVLNQCVRYVFSTFFWPYARSGHAPGTCRERLGTSLGIADCAAITGSVMPPSILYPSLYTRGISGVTMQSSRRNRPRASSEAKAQIWRWIGKGIPMLLIAVQLGGSSLGDGGHFAVSEGPAEGTHGSYCAKTSQLQAKSGVRCVAHTAGRFERRRMAALEEMKGQGEVARRQ